MILNEKFYNASEIELKILRRVRFSIRFFFKKKAWFSGKNILKSTVLKKIFFKKARLWKKFARKKSRFASIYPVKCANFAFYVHF